VLNLYQHVNSPEARLYLSRQLFEEAVHVQFNLTLLDTYVPDEAERAQAFAAVENISSIARKARFCFTWIDSVYQLRELRTERADNHFISAERNAAHVRSLQRRHVDIHISSQCLTVVWPSVDYNAIPASAQLGR
jgi:ribonucleotide reductase beta subunit family protein with ferritin-like domain